VSGIPPLGDDLYAGGLQLMPLSRLSLPALYQ
jgi:hypothetical protein